MLLARNRCVSTSLCNAQRVKPICNPISRRELLLRHTITSSPSQHIHGTFKFILNASSGAGASIAPEPLQRITTFLSSQFLPVALLFSLLVGALQPAWGTAASNTPLQKYMTVTIFVLSGLSLKRGDALLALRSTGSLAYGLLSILVLTPLLSLAALALPLERQALCIGLAVFCCMPTSLSSNIAMTQTLGGNTALSLLLTISSNMLAVFTLPLVVPALLATAVSCASGGVQLQALPLLKQLMAVVLAPSLVGAAAREFVPGVAPWVDSHRALLSYLSSVCLCMVPWMQVSRAMSHGISLSPQGLAATVAAGVVLHVAFLALNLTAANALRLGGADPVQATRTRQAVVLATSQKTLPVAITMVTQLSTMLGHDVGLAAVAVVFAHLSQIVIDSWLVAHWLRQQQQQ